MRRVWSRSRQRYGWAIWISSCLGRDASALRPFLCRDEISNPSTSFFGRAKKDTEKLFFVDANA